MTTGWLAASGGFLIGVLWMDLLFDVQVIRHRELSQIPEDTLASIGAYYRRVTTEARPLGHAVGCVMLIAAVGAIAQIVRAEPARWVGIASLALVVGPIALAVRRVLPNAVRLGAREGSAQQQSDLARSICRDHFVCLAAMIALVMLQLWATRP